ncbi:MAG TPA: hypothetical protein VGH55_02005 [Chthoniobacterales bacterium]
MKTSGSRERLVEMHLPVTFDSFIPGHRAASPWVIPGSRLLGHFLAARSAETNIGRRLVKRQSGSPPGVGNK